MPNINQISCFPLLIFSPHPWLTSEKKGAGREEVEMMKKGGNEAIFPKRVSQRLSPGNRTASEPPPPGTFRMQSVEEGESSIATAPDNKPTPVTSMQMQSDTPADVVFAYTWGRGNHICPPSVGRRVEAVV